MKWNHLPGPGGLYQQHPDLLDRFQYIFSAQAEEQRKEQEREKGKTKTPRPSMGGGPRR